MTDIVERLRAYTMGDFDTYAVLRHRGEWIAQVTMIREASDLVETVYAAAAEIERLRLHLAELQAAYDAERGPQQIAGTDPGGMRVYRDARVTDRNPHGLRVIKGQRS